MCLLCSPRASPHSPGVPQAHVDLHRLGAIKLVHLHHAVTGEVIVLVATAPVAKREGYGVRKDSRGAGIEVRAWIWWAYMLQGLALGRLHSLRGSPQLSNTGSPAGVVDLQYSS